MTDPDRITTDAELRAMDDDEIVSAWRAGAIDSEAIAAEREQHRADNANAAAAAHRNR